MREDAANERGIGMSGSPKLPRGRAEGRVKGRKMPRQQIRGVPLEHLREWRFYRMLTQKQLASHADISHVAVSYVEAGIKNASFESVRKLAEALDISVDKLRFHAPPEQQDFLREESGGI
jgi:DNA-binding XRE family transcriptional regulator